MNKAIVIIFVFTGISLAACKKEGFTGLETSPAPVPVNVTNLFGFYNGVPTVSASVSGGGALTITLAVPPGSGRTIKEITKVAVATTPNNYKVVETATGLYNPSPIAANAGMATFSTSLAEYSSKTGIAVTASGTATSFLTRYFMFLVTLDNGEQLYPVGVRVYVAS